MDKKIITDREFESIKAEETLVIIKRCIEKELCALSKRKGTILEERTYFIDYYYELSDDEKRNLLKNELLDTKAYSYTLGMLSRYGKQLKEPYFARFDFKESDEKEAEKYYISIHTLRDNETGEIVTYDWRAPISSLYYEKEPGNTYYDAPDGKVEGVLLLKRQYKFKEGKLLRFSDISMPSDDEMLTEALSQNSDTHMKTILQTLQKDQHKIIRDYIEGVSIVEGCAGSGKSSVALHKAAYVLYYFRDKLKDQHMCIISPNNIFSEYISSVLPDLGEENIDQLLPEDIVNECLVNIENYSFKNRMELQEDIYVSDKSEFYRSMSESKSSLVFRNVIMKYINYLNLHIFKAEDIFIDRDAEIIVSAEEINSLFYNVLTDKPLLTRAPYIARFIYKKYKVNSADMKDSISMMLLNMYRSMCITQLYSLMYSDDEFEQILTDEEKSVLRYPNNELNTFEDSCAVAVMNLLITEPDDLRSMFYLIADEAQDFTPIFMQLLQVRFRGCNMLFVGDSNQIVFNDSGYFVDNIKQIIVRRPLRLYKLDVNYRSTRQINSFAESYIGLPAGNNKSVCMREGSKPIVSDGERNNISKAAEALRFISEKYDQGYANFAVITKSKKEADMCRGLINLPNRVAAHINFCCIPVYLAKGLEYDCVAIWDRDSFAKDNADDMKLMYTACTRAMHELILL